MRFRFKTLYAVVLLGVMSQASAGLYYPDHKGDFFDRAHEGWFWYEKMLSDKTPKKHKVVKSPAPKSNVETMKVPPAPVAKATSPAPTSDTTPSGPPAFTAAWFRKNLPKYRDRAWNDPTPQNVAAFMYVQKMVLNRSERFSNVWRDVIATDPILDANSVTPTATNGSLLMREAVYNKRKTVLKSLKSTIGILFFYNGSKYSAEQARTLDAIHKQYGVPVLAASVDGSSLPSDVKLPSRIDAGQAKHLHVHSVPATFVMLKDHSFIPIGEGIFAMPTVENRMLLVAQSNGLISEKDYMETQFRLHETPDLITDLEKAEHSNPNLKANLQSVETGKDGFIPPAQLLNKIHQEIDAQ